MDIWDWFRGLRRWWWMLVLIPGITFAISWFGAPKPQYEISWKLHIIFDNPELANSPTYIDFILLDDMTELVQSSVLGDVIYLKLPDQTKATLGRDAFGDMVSSRRHAHFVSITVSGSAPETVSTVAHAINDELPDAVNTYLMPPSYVGGPANIIETEPMTEPHLNTTPRNRVVGATTLASILVALAGTGIAEWLRMSYSAKYGAK